MPAPVSAARSAALMQQAVAMARAGIAAGQSPFAALIFDVRAATLLAREHNQVWARHDPTAHAEVNAIRAAASAGTRIDFSGCWLWSTCEPCPMCMAAIHWARLDGVVYGATIADAARAGFNELALPARTLLEMGGSRVQLVEGESSDECRQLFAEWKAAARSSAY